MNQAHPARWLAWPALLYLTVFFLIPTVSVVGCSFYERDFHGDVIRRFSVEGWREATSEVTRTIFVRTLGLALGVTGGCLVLGYPCAMVLARMAARWRQVWMLLLGFPLVTSLLLRIYGWLNLLPLEWQGSLWTVGLVLTANYLPFMVLPLTRAWERSDRTLALAAMDLGATPWQTFWYVTWPLTRSGMWAGCALVLIPVAGEYLVPHFIGQGKVSVLGTLIVEQFMERRNWPYAAATALWLLGLVLLPMLAATLGRVQPLAAAAPERRSNPA